MNGGLVVLLALVWALVLLPGALRSRRSSPTTSVGTFERAMHVLASDGRSSFRSPRGRAVYVPSDAGRIVGDLTRRRNAIVAQRRRTFVRLLIATAALFPVAVFVGGATWAVFLGVVAALGTYVGLLRRWKSQAERADEVVRMLPDPPAGHTEGARRGEPPERRRAAGGGGDVYDFQVATRPDEPWRPQTGVRIRRWDA